MKFFDFFRGRGSRIQKALARADELAQYDIDMVICEAEQVIEKNDVRAAASRVYWDLMEEAWREDVTLGRLADAHELCDVNVVIADHAKFCQDADFEIRLGYYNEIARLVDQMIVNNYDPRTLQ